MASDPTQVLLVEDDDLFAQILLASLRRSNPELQLERAGSLGEAAAALAARTFAAVLLDLNLPDGSGVGNIQRILRLAPAIPIVVLTGATAAEAALAAVQHGAQDYLIKGETDGKLLSRAIRYAIERASFQAEIAQREQRFRALIENAYDIVVVLAPDGSFLYHSPAVGRVLGYAAEEIDGTNVLDLVHPDDRERAASVLGTSPLPTGTDAMFHFRLRHKDGTWRVLEALGREIDANPDNGIVVNARDITERLGAEETLRATEARLRQVHKMEAVGRLAGGIAHDFNNVLTAIYGYSDLLLDEFDQADPRRRDLEEIRRSAERAAALTRQLLAFSRQQMLQPRVLDLNAVVDEVRRMLDRIVGTDIQISFEPGPDLWPVRADRGQIEQVLMNLGGNARDAMPEGGWLVITTANRTVTSAMAAPMPGLKAGEYVTLTVSDTGMGMPEEIRRHIFEPFFTTKEQGEGTGLGLATVYGIVKQSGGSVYVESEPGKGSTFTIYLPPHADASSSP